jgi:hypothetical protein
VQVAHELLNTSPESLAPDAAPRQCTMTLATLLQERGMQSDSGVIQQPTVSSILQSCLNRSCGSSGAQHAVGL